MKNFKQFLANMGIIIGIPAAGVGIGVGGTYLAFDIAKNINSEKGAGLNLNEPGAHIKSGKHRVVVTEQFCKDYLNKASEVDKKITLNGIKQAYKELNEACDGVSFELCSTENELIEFGFNKVSELKKEDIPLYVADIADLGEKVLASANYKYRPFSGELKDLSITYRKDALDTIYSEDYLDNPKNSIVYSLTVHEAMHTMGFAHEEKRDSVMYPYLSTIKLNCDFLQDENYSCLTDKDKLALDKYCIQFYGAEPKYKENGGKVSINETHNQKYKLAEELSF